MRRELCEIQGVKELLLDAVTVMNQAACQQTTFPLQWPRAASWSRKCFRSRFLCAFLNGSRAGACFSSRNNATCNSQGPHLPYLVSNECPYTVPYQRRRLRIVTSVRNASCHLHATLIPHTTEGHHRTLCHTLPGLARQDRSESGATRHLQSGTASVLSFFPRSHLLY